MKKEISAIKEAKMRGIKIIAIAHTNVDPTLADYPIPANDDAVVSVKYILEKIKDAVLKAKPKIQTKS
jgi:small subunit ribosomal protein S2